MQSLRLGSVVTRTDIRSSLGPFRVLPAEIRYPEVVTQALCDLYAEYNRAFSSLAEANREWPEDYGFCSPPNFAVQVDMAGLTQSLLDELSGMRRDEVREVLRPMIFEIENSMAMYHMLEQLFPQSDRDSFFARNWRATLDGLRSQHGRPVALLAVTDEKYAAMAGAEFGCEPGVQVPDVLVRELSGFDAFFGPEQFLRHLQDNGGQCGYLLYVRSSDPVPKLRQPGLEVVHPLLGDAAVRKQIKACSLTLNVDAPGMPSDARINDSKEYMPELGMGCRLDSWEDFGGTGFKSYLSNRDIAPEQVLSGERVLRCKPIKGTYGCYGHLRGRLSDKRFRTDLRRALRLRGAYIVQLELPAARVHNRVDLTDYVFIDRNFVGMVGGRPVFLGGFRNYMPASVTEAREGRIHGNGAAVWGEIVPAA